MKSRQKILHHLIVIELKDVKPRRRADRPNLYVGLTTSAPEKRFEELRTGRGGPDWIAGQIVRHRPDLARRFPAPSRENAQRQKRKLVTRLSRQGFTVNRNTREWRVYVIELDPRAVADPGKGYVYVGQTSRTPEERFEQHISGARNKRGPLYSRQVCRHGRKLRRDLSPKRVYFSKVDAEVAEAEWRARLEKLGYHAIGGH